MIFTQTWGITDISSEIKLNQKQLAIIKKLALKVSGHLTHAG
jgi:hypothetical protein